MIGVHLQDTADAFALVLRRVEHVGPRLEDAGVDAEVGQLADVGIDRDLERQRRERRFVRSLAARFAAVRQHADDRRHVER